MAWLLQQCSRKLLHLRKSPGYHPYNSSSLITSSDWEQQTENSCEDQCRGIGYAPRPIINLEINLPIFLERTDDWLWKANRLIREIQLEYVNPVNLILVSTQGSCLLLAHACSKHRTVAPSSRFPVSLDRPDSFSFFIYPTHIIHTMFPPYIFHRASSYSTIFKSASYPCWRWRCPNCTGNIKSHLEQSPCNNLHVLPAVENFVVIPFVQLVVNGEAYMAWIYPCFSGHLSNQGVRLRRPLIPLLHALRDINNCFFAPNVNSIL